MKKLLVVLAILFIGILLAGCTQEAAPVTTPAPTPVPTVEPTKVIEIEKEKVVVVVEETTEATPVPTPTEQPTTTITFTQDLTIMPSATVYVKAGTKVIWKNDDPYKPHFILANDVATAAYFGSTDEITIPYGGTIEVTFDKVGAFDYTTGPFQPQQQGKIIVTAQ
jgi:plastocyanin